MAKFQTRIRASEPSTYERNIDQAHGDALLEYHERWEATQTAEWGRKFTRTWDTPTGEQLKAMADAARAVLPADRIMERCTVVPVYADATLRRNGEPVTYERDVEEAWELAELEDTARLIDYLNATGTRPIAPNPHPITIKYYAPEGYEQKRINGVWERVPGHSDPVGGVYVTPDPVRDYIRGLDYDKLAKPINRLLALQKLWELIEMVQEEDGNE